MSRLLPTHGRSNKRAKLILLRLGAMIVTAACWGLATPPNVHAAEVEATGALSMTTAPGILPAWASAEITLIGIAPGSVATGRFGADATVTLPVVAKNGTANATAGGFRIVNTETGKSVRCMIPTVDTRARVIDCLTSAGYNTAVFQIEDIGNRQSFVTPTSRTTIFEDMDIRLTASGAVTLNRELEANVFSTSVKVADASLIVSRAR